MTESSTFLWVAQEERDPSLQAEGRARRRDVAGLPGEVGLWVFVLGDMTIFGAFFTVFAWELRDDRSTFSLAAAALHQPIGVLNTLLLLISSYAVVVALHAHRRSVPGLRRRALLAALVCGSAFLVSKAVEYSLEIGCGPHAGDQRLLHVLLRDDRRARTSRRDRHGPADPLGPAIGP